jgi:hypothetical protein
LKLPGEILTAVKEGKITVSQGYIFAANLDNPGLMETFNAALTTRAGDLFVSPQNNIDIRHTMS